MGKESSRFHLQAHHLDNIESLVNGVTKRVAKFTRRKKIYPWEVEDKVELKKIALAVGHAWSEYNIESMLKMAVESARDFRKCIERLELSEVLVRRLLNISRKMWLESGTIDASWIFEYEFGFSRSWLDKERGELDFLSRVVISKCYFEDLFGQLQGEKTVKAVIKRAGVGEYPGVVRMINGHRSLGFRYVMYAADHPEGLVVIDRETDGFCEAAGVTKSVGEHCKIPSVDIRSDRNSTNMVKLARLAEDWIEEEVVGSYGVDELSIRADRLWKLLEKYEWA